MLSRGSATPSDRGAGDGGGVCGQMADIHTSNWLLAVAQRADEIRIRLQTLMEEFTVSAEESERPVGESTGLGVLVEAARMDSNATLTGAHDVQTLQMRLGTMEEGQDRCAGHISRLHRKMNASAEKLMVLNGEMLAFTAEMAHFCETNPAAARSAGSTEKNLPPRAGPFQAGGDASPSGRAATGDAPPAQNDAKVVVVADGESHSREGLSEPMSACGIHKLLPFGLTTDTTVRNRLVLTLLSGETCAQTPLDRPEMHFRREPDFADAPGTAENGGFRHQCTAACCFADFRPSTRRPRPKASFAREHWLRNVAALACCFAPQGNF